MGFSRFNLSPQIFRAITDLGYAEPTPVQAAVLPEALAGRDIRACAQTGTGKTLAFVVPILEKLIKKPPSRRPSVLILTPTRELASQIVSMTRDLSRHNRARTALLIGGANFNKQVSEIRAGADIVVATPGRLMDHLEQRTMNLQGIDILVLDEADRMLDMGFLPAIRRILAVMPGPRQTLLLSATFDKAIKELASQFLKNPVTVDLTPATSTACENVTQMVYPIRQEQKKALLQALLELDNMTSALIFTRTKHGADRLQRHLQGLGRKVAVIHSNRSQSQREQALQGFKDRRYQILVATDIAARGIDVKDISHVINFDVPRFPEDYVHRIGRTGRAQAVGEAFTFVSPDEESHLRHIEKFIKKTIPRGVIPDFPYQSKPQMFPGLSTSHHKPSGGHGGPSHGGSSRPHGGPSHPHGGHRPGGPGWKRKPRKLNWGRYK